MQVKLDKVSKIYGPITALKEVSLNIHPGEFSFIVGPSGSGKSTLIKLLLHQITPTSGEIVIDGHSYTQIKSSKIEAIRRQIGVIFQDHQLVTDKTLEENIALALDIVGYPHYKFSSKIDEVIQKVGLSSRRYLFPSQLSGGELQRAALARALAIGPKLILADEPTGNLDAHNSWYLIKLLHEINQTSGTTIIMTTHNLDIISSLDHRTITLRNGVIAGDTAKPPKTKKPKNEHPQK